MPPTETGRTAGHPISKLFLDRWSPRAFDGQPVPRADLMTMLEAARWAPSASKPAALALPLRSQGRAGLGAIPGLSQRG
jgi:nitroreductase